MFVSAHPSPIFWYLPVGFLHRNQHAVRGLRVSGHGHVRWGPIEHSDTPSLSLGKDVVEAPCGIHLLLSKSVGLYLSTVRAPPQHHRGAANSTRGRSRILVDHAANRAHDYLMIGLNRTVTPQAESNATGTGVENSSENFMALRHASGPWAFSSFASMILST